MTDGRKSTRRPPRLFRARRRRPRPGRLGSRAFDRGRLRRIARAADLTPPSYRRFDPSRLDDCETSDLNYAATKAEAREYTDAPVIVVGVGNEAGQATLFLAQSCPVAITIRGSYLGASMSSYLVGRIHADDRINLSTETRVTALRATR